MNSLLGKTNLSILALISFFFLQLYTLAWGGSKADELMERANQVFGRLPPVMASGKNSVTPEKVKLGKILFYEIRISVDGTVSCSRCHPFSLYGADGLRKSIGNRCMVNPRNAPTILNATAQISEHWRGRTS